jgi:REP element-mobilizing transposase RayT
MSHICHFYHIVFSTKERRTLIDDAWRPRLIEYVGGIIHNLNGQMVRANATNDHIHIATTAPVTIAYADFVGKIKSNSSRWVRQDVGASMFGWQDGYASFAVSRSIVPRVIRYIDSQQEHHRTRDFQAELIEMLDRHGVKYDPRYILA